MLRLRECLPWRYLAAGALGLALAVGPAPHLAGRPHPSLGWPYRLAEQVLPPLRGLGCPVRFALLGNLGVAVAATFGMVVLLAWAERGGRWRRSLAFAVPALLVAELWPAPPPTSRYPAPEFLRALATVDGPGAVVDLTGWTHPLWNQMLHGRPIVHGYIARRPMRLVAKVRRDPVLGPLYAQALYGRAPRVVALRRVEAKIGGRWGNAAPAPEVAADFELDYAGTLTLPRAGEVHFGLGSDDGAVLTLDGRVVVDNGGAHPYREREGRIALTAGPHALRLRFRDLGGEAHLTLWAEGPGLPKGPLPAALLRAPDGSQGLLATYWHRVARPHLRGAAARKHLRQTWGVRWLIAYVGRLPALVIQDLGLREIGRGEGLVLYEVPP
ncbi:MAG: hypothetical protein D6729_18345 [Deltaproteobacteria bacterium]|nr:MAG: hypothetical protein D6729_18345 [Deltaproteobacteria bacterium]